MNESSIFEISTETVCFHKVSTPGIKLNGYYALSFSISEQTAQTFLSKGVALEFRYSFSQAEIILSDTSQKTHESLFWHLKVRSKRW